MSFLSGDTNTPMAPNASTTETVLPDWYTNYAMGVLSNQQALSATPYATYQGPRVAGMTPLQEQAAQQTGQAATSYQPGLDAATAATQGALGRSSYGAAQPYLGAAGALSGTAAANPYFAAATGTSGMSAASPFLGQAAAGYGASANPLGMNAASPYLNAAGQSSVSNIQQYMNPYMDAVVDRIGVLGNRNLQENLLPQISDQFVGAGGYGGTRQAESIGKAVRETQQGISAAQAQALADGYGTAVTTASGDLNRQGALAQTAGNLGVQQQQALANAAQGIGALGTTAGNLTNENNQLNASIGQNAGALALDEQRNLTNLGQTSASIYGADTANQLAGGAQMGALAQTQQQLGLNGAGALNDMGQQQQALDQKNMDVAYADFLRQQGYPQEQIDAMAKTLTGVAPAVPKGTLQQGYGAVGSPTTGTSGAQNIASILAGLGSIF